MFQVDPVASHGVTTFVPSGFVFSASTNSRGSYVNPTDVPDRDGLNGLNWQLQVCPLSLSITSLPPTMPVLAPWLAAGDAAAGLALAAGLAAALAGAPAALAAGLATALGAGVAELPQAATARTAATPKASGLNRLTGTSSSSCVSCKVVDRIARRGRPASTPGHTASATLAVTGSKNRGRNARFASRSAARRGRATEKPPTSGCARSAFSAAARSPWIAAATARSS